jgi:hypothetical protein
MQGEEKTYGSLTIIHDERDDTFVVTKRCPNCGQKVELHSTQGRQTFRLGLQVRRKGVVTVTKCPLCFFVIDFSPDEARVLNYPIEKFRRFFNHIKSRPKWDSTWSTKGLLQEK